MEHKRPRKRTRNKNGKRQREVCPTKIPYVSYEIAVNEAIGFRRGGGVVLKPYHCSVCGLFHLTSKPVDDKEMPTVKISEPNPETVKKSMDIYDRELTARTFLKKIKPEKKVIKKLR